MILTLAFIKFEILQNKLVFRAGDFDYRKGFFVEFFKRFSLHYNLYKLYERVKNKYYLFKMSSSSKSMDRSIVLETVDLALGEGSDLVSHLTVSISIFVSGSYVSIFF